jgi:uncharacterized membrane protein YfcA
LSLAAQVLLSLLAALALIYIWRWAGIERARGAAGSRAPGFARPAIGFVANFFDTLGVGSFAPTTAVFKLLKLVPDEKIPGTLNSGHALPTVTQALIFIAAVTVDPLTLVSMIAAAVVGAWFGAGIVSRLPRRAIQVGMGVALLVAAVLFVMKNLSVAPTEGQATGLHGTMLVFAVAVNFVLGILMTLGIGLYAPCLILCSMLGMSTIAAFPIMMGSCAFLMPVAGQRFVKSGKYDARAAIGLAIGGIPGVILAWRVLDQFSVVWLRWLVVVVALYAALVMLDSARKASAEPG